MRRMKRRRMRRKTRVEHLLSLQEESDCQHDDCVLPVVVNERKMKNKTRKNERRMRMRKTTRRKNLKWILRYSFETEELIDRRTFATKRKQIKKKKKEKRV